MKYTPFILGAIASIIIFFLSLTLMVAPHPGADSVRTYLELKTEGEMTLGTVEKTQLVEYFQMVIAPKTPLFYLSVISCIVLLIICIYGIYRERIKT